MAGKKKKIRTSFRKNREARPRNSDLTTKFHKQGNSLDDEASRSERISGKGALTRKRTVVGVESEAGQSGLAVVPEVDLHECLKGRVLRSGGLHSTVEADTGEIYECATRRLLKTLSTDQRHIVAAGDRVYFRPADHREGIIERVEPRHGVLCRTSKGRQHVLVANVDQILIVSSAAEPTLKPHLIDRLLVTAEQSRITPIICVNKIDLVDPADLQPLLGVFGQMGYQICLLSATTGAGVPLLRELVRDRQSVVVGQSGVGKSSLLNAIEDGLQLRIRTVSTETQKGRHTTTSAQLIPLAMGGYIVDTPGIRQFQLWDIIPREVGGLFRDLRPFVNNCRFPNCSHTHEAECAVKDSVADGKIDARRYESYCQLFENR
jgi:ribosome biogenesis GTPase